MNPKLKTIKALIFTSIFLSSWLIGFRMITENEQTASAALIEFHSYMDMAFKTEPLNDPLAIDVSVTIPITIKYSTDIPDIFTRIPFPLNFMFLFGQPIGPMQKIHLEIENPPDWANIFLSSPDIYMDIPFHTNGQYEVTTELILSPRVEAPAESYTITIKASCEDIGKLKGITYQKSISFTPSFIPTIGITTDQPIRTVGPHESINFKITVSNRGNKITRVTPIIRNASGDWTPTINPTQIEIPSNSETTFTFSTISPFDFGWHNEYERFQIDFTAEAYPYQQTAAINTRSVYLVVNNYGFSMPGFELVYIFAGLIFIGFIMKRKRNNK